MLVKQLVAVFPIIASAAAQTATIILQSNQAGKLSSRRSILAQTRLY